MAVKLTLNMFRFLTLTALYCMNGKGYIKTRMIKLSAFSLMEAIVVLTLSSVLLVFVLSYVEIFSKLSRTYESEFGRYTEQIELHSALKKDIEKSFYSNLANNTLLLETENGRIQYRFLSEQVERISRNGNLKYGVTFSKITSQFNDSTLKQSYHLFLPNDQVMVFQQNNIIPTIRKKLSN